MPRIINNHIVVPTNQPERLVAIFPDLKQAEIDGQSYCAMPHTIETARVLNNLGFKAPSPILTQYRWPGRYEPLAHQLHTAEFLTLNPRCFCLNDMGCISGDAKIRVCRKGKSKEESLRDLYRKFHKLPDKYAWKVRSLKGEYFGLHTLVDVLHQGTKKTIIITTENGKSVRCTPDHSIAVPGGKWTYAGDLRVGDTLLTNGAYVCPICGSTRELAFPPRRSKVPCIKCKYATQKTTLRGSKNPNWKGGRRTSSDGYITVKAPGHPREDNNGYVPEHILVMEKHLGYFITNEFHVHHKDEVRYNNKISNLEVLTVADHHRLHNPWPKLDGQRSSKGGMMVVIPKESKVISIVGGGHTDVYDLVMEAPYHNFVANGIVVHNSMKTLSSLWAVDYLQSVKLVNKALVISPLSTLTDTWGREIFQNFPMKKYAVLHGSRNRRKDLLSTDADIYIINHEGIKILEPELLKRPDIDLFIIDELAMGYRNQRTSKWKSLNRLINASNTKRMIWGMTGAPTPKEPPNAYAQMKLVKPDNYNGHYTTFKHETMFQLSQFKWVPKKGAEQSVNRILQPSIRYALSDCVNLPETIQTHHKVELSTEQQKHYKELLREAATEINGTMVTAVNAAVLIGKIIQAALGVLYGVDGAVLKIDHAPRIKVVRELIEACNQKVIIFVPLTGALKSIASELRKDWSVEIIDGSVPVGRRNDIFQRFRASDDPHILVANAAAMSHGLTLTEASLIIWYAPITNNDTYIQANARIVRPGQKYPTQIAHLYATSEEKRIYESLAARGKLQDLVLDLIKKS